MAVALYNHSGPVSISGVTQIAANVDCGGLNRAGLVLLMLQPSGSAPTNVQATWDQHGAGQAMSLIESWTAGSILSLHVWSGRGVGW